MKELIKNTVVLTAITLIAGLLLGVVYEITKDPIAASKKATEDKACKQVFSEAASFDINYVMEEDGKAIVEQLQVDASIDQVIPAKDEAGQVLGYVVTVTSNEGYGGEITFMMGVKCDGVVNGIYMLSISETAGLGMNAKKDTFLEQYTDKEVEHFTVSKSGSQSEDQIDAITGATITSKAVTNAVNAGRQYVLDVLEKEGE